jgi:hypothetical protein
MLQEETRLVCRSIKLFLVGAFVSLLSPKFFRGIGVHDLVFRRVESCGNDRICGA